MNSLVEKRKGKIVGEGFSILGYYLLGGVKGFNIEI